MKPPTEPPAGSDPVPPEGPWGDLAAALAEMVGDAVLVLDRDLVVKSANTRFFDRFGGSPSDVDGLALSELSGPPWNLSAVQRLVSDVPPDVDDVELSLEIEGRPCLVRARRAEQGQTIVLTFGSVESDGQQPPMRESLGNYRALFEFAEDGFCLIEIIFDEQGRPDDYRFIEANSAFVRHSGLENAVGSRVSELVPDLDDYWYDTYGNVALTGEPIHFISHAPAMKRWFDVFAAPAGGPGKHQVALLFRDVTHLKETEDALRRSEERFRGTFENAAVGIAHVGLDGKWLAVNQRLCEIVGYTKEELLSLTFQDITHPDDLEPDEQALQRLLGGEISRYQLDKRYIRKDGSHIWITLTVSLIYTPAGDPDYCISIIKDISERKAAEAELRRSERRFRNMADTAPAMLWMTDTRNRCRFLSKAWYDFTGQNESEALGFGWLDAVHPDDRDAARADFLRSSETQRPVSLDFRLRHRDGGFRWVIDEGRPRFTEDGRWRGYIGFVSDVHERRLATEALRASEHRLRELSQSLEHRVAQRTVQLSEQAARLRNMTARLAQAEQRERKRLAALLHDGLQQLLFAAGIQLTIARDHDLSQEARAAVEEACQHIDEALESARNLTRQLRPPALYEAGIVPALTWLAKDMEDRHRLHVDVDARSEAPSLNDDAKAMLFECVRELLFNIVKHASAGSGRVQIREGGGQVVIEVHDDGTGFNPDQADLASRTSFGLFSIRERISAFGGSTDIVSAPGAGTTISLRLPIGPDAAAVTPDPVDTLAPAGGWTPLAAAASPNHALQVLVVDDHAIVREGIATVLSADERIRVIGEAADGMEALKALENLQPDVVLMDVNMPRMNGVETSREIRRRWPTMVVVGMSVQGDDSTANSMIDAGATAFVPKSGDSGAMIDAIVSAYGRAG